MAENIDTTNRYFVGAHTGGRVMITLPPLAPMSPDEALTLAAWLVAVADPIGDRFEEIFTAVMST